MNWSFWEYDAFLKDPDVIIIGSGIVGLNTAISLKLQAPSLKVMVLERGALPSGASTKNAGFACFGSLTELLDDMEQVGEDRVWELVQLRWEGLQRMKSVLGEKAIQYLPLGGYELFRAQDREAFHSCMEQRDHINQQISSITGLKETYILEDEKIPSFGFDQTEHLILNQGEGQIHTGFMMKALLEKAHGLEIQILNGLQVAEIVDAGNQVILQMENGSELKVPKVIVATNGFARRLLPDLAVFPARNQVLITKPIPGLPFQGTFHYDQGYVYFRNIGERVLIGGARNLDKVGETTDAFGFTEQILSELKSLLKTVVLPQYAWEIERTWSGIMGVGEEKKPVLQFTSPNVLVAVRLGGMGVAIGSWVGEQAAKMYLA